MAMGLVETGLEMEVREKAIWLLAPMVLGTLGKLLRVAVVRSLEMVKERKLLEEIWALAN